MSCGDDNNLARLAVKAGAGEVDFSSGSTRARFISNGVKATGSILASDSITGSRHLDVAETARGAYTIAGPVAFDTSVRDILLWCYYALGTNTTGVLTPATTLPVFGLMADNVSANKVFQFGDCKVNRVTLGSSGNQLVRGTADILGRSYWGDDNTFPSGDLGSDETYQPLAHSGLTVTADSADYKINQWQLAIDNQIDPKQRNGQYVDCLREGQLLITLSMNLPSNSASQTAFDEPDLTGVAASLELEHPTAAIGATFDFPALQKPRDTPTVQGRGEQLWDLNFRAVIDRANTVTTPLTITCDTTE